jgi:hypothetical protein
MSEAATGKLHWARSLARVLGLALLLVAVPVIAQEELAQDDFAQEELAQEELRQAAVDSLLAAAEEAELMEPNAQAIAIEPVDMWNTGVSPTAAVVMTPLFPGWGQLYARNSWQAALGFGSEMYFWTNMLVRDRRAVRANDFGESLPEGDPIRERYRAIADENWEQMRDFAWWSGGVLLIIALDAYVGAHLFNFDQDPVSVPDRWDETFGRVGDSMPGTADGPSLVVFQWRKAF